MTQLAELSGDLILPVLVVPVGGGTAGTAESVSPVRMPHRGALTAAYWTPRAAITADPTNYFTLSLINKGAAAGGSTSMATRSYAATNSVAFVPEAMTLSATAANLNFAAGDVIVVDKAVAASGLAMPQGLIVIHYKLR